MNVSGCFGDDRLDHRDRDAPRRGGGHVDIGWRDLHRSDRAQALAGGNHVAIQFVMEQAEHDVQLRHPDEQFALGDFMQRVGVQLDIGDRA